MVDSFEITKIIKINERIFTPLSWKCIGNNYEIYYEHDFYNGSVKYFPDSSRIIVEGKLATFFERSQVKNVDDMFGTNAEPAIDLINRQLRMLFGTDVIDIRNFRVWRIDYCFNVKTPYVKEYLEFMSAAFQHRNNGRRIDFTNKKSLSGSLYIKPAGEFKDKKKRSYCLNFYDKTDWIEKKEGENIYISDADKKLAVDIFRLEVQCYYLKIKDICKKHNVNNSFGDLCNISIAYDTISSVYKSIFGGDDKCAYVQYEETKKIRFSSTVENQLRLSAQHHGISQYAAKKAIENNIYPYYFLPAKGKLKQLENPMMLIRKKIEAIN